jgi:type III restriction enzyme
LAGKRRRYLFTGFRRCLYTEEKFQADPERMLAIILDRDALKWFRPAKGQFQIFYRDGAEHQEYQPDFVAEASDIIYMLESKRRSELGTVVVEAKKAAAVQWCQHATAHAATYNGKPWRYVLIPHDVIAENMTLEVLAGQFGVE